MRILCTNDDGIDAPGLHALRQIAEQLSDDVWVVAPMTNQSGTGHSLTLHDPIRLREIGPRAYAVNGTPTDSVIMAVRHIMKGRRPDLVLSGVNRGANMAEDVTYSGTIAGAFEGTLIGIRSIALSQAYAFETANMPRWETAIHYAPDIIRKLLGAYWGESVLYNVNFPDRAPDDVLGIEATVQGRRDQDVLDIEARMDTWGNPYYWLGYARRRSNPPRGTDLWAIYNGWVSVTPLAMNMTHRASLEALKRSLEA
jgi:5'-nucleotidase